VTTTLAVAGLATMTALAACSSADRQSDTRPQATVGSSRVTTPPLSAAAASASPAPASVPGNPSCRLLVATKPAEALGTDPTLYDVGAGGDGLSETCYAYAGGDPHSYQPQPNLRSAKLRVDCGAGIEGSWDGIRAKGTPLADSAPGAVWVDYGGIALLPDGCLLTAQLVLGTPAEALDPDGTRTAVLLGRAYAVGATHQGPLLP
jgi:hypothetical protein